MSWRRITVDDATYRWTTSVTVRFVSGELPALQVLVIVRGETGRITATFHGWCVEDLWDGRRQNLAIRPAIVAAIIRHGASIDHAERVYPDAVIAGDPEDVALAAACAQWFVPYPGRAALHAALVEADFDHAAVATRFGVTPAQIAHWTTRLGLGSSKSA